MVFDEGYIKTLPDVRAFDNPHVVALCKFEHLTPHRDDIERWFQAIPTEHKTDLKARLRSLDNGEHLGALYELVLNQYCIEDGLNPDFHHTTSDGLTPDIYADAGQGKQFLLEVTTQLDEDDFRRKNTLKHALDEAIHKITTPFVLSLSYRDYPPDQAAVNQASVATEKWLGGLNPKSLEHHILDLTPYGVAMDVDAKTEDIKPRTGCVLFISGPGSTGLPGVDKLKNTLAKKRRKYSSAKTKLPLVVAICDATDHMLSDETVVDRGLYGHTTITFAVDGSDAESKVGRDNSGYVTPNNSSPLAETRNKGISAVLYVSRTQESPGKIQYKMRVFHNPWAYVPLPETAFKNMPQLVVTRNDDTGVELQWNMEDHEKIRTILTE